MKISIISIGKFENSPHKAVFEHYLKRIKWKIELRELELKNSLNLSSNELKNREGELILKALKPQSKLIILDENGKDFSSRNFAKLFADFALQGDSNLTFVIGGSDGLSDELKSQAQLKISLSKLTFPHLMVRAILIEQIYRAQSIIAGHPYHRD
jgi:23S rRNA (pseudouridine1915-N3)-methyltransferase